MPMTEKKSMTVIVALATFRFALAPALLALALGGCRPADPLAEVVFLKAGDVTVTAKDAKDAAEFLAAAQAAAGRPLADKKRVRWINNQAMKVTPSLLSGALLDREFRKRGVTPSPAAVETVLNRYRKTVRKPKATLDEIASAFGDYEKYFRRQFARECRLEQYLSTREGIVPTDEDVEIITAQLKGRIATNAAEDAEAKKRGDAAWQRLQSGESWSAVATACSEDKLLYGDDCDYANEWETVSPKHFYLEEVAKALPGMKTGDFTKPIETDEGLVIVKVLGTEGEGEDVEYRCARILIRLKAKMELPDREGLKKQLERENRAEAQRELLAEIRETVKYEYPMGTNFTYQVIPEPTKAKKERAKRKKAKEAAAKEAAKE